MRTEMKLLLDVIMSMLCVVLAMDVLYLYIYGWWYDPLLAVEVLELVALGAIAIAGTVNSIWAIGRLRDGADKER